MTELVLPKGERTRTLAKVCDFLAQLSAEKAWAVEVRVYSRTRTDAQNRYLWGVAYAELQRATGHEAEDWHEYMLGEWSGWETHELFGRRKMKPRRRSSRLTTSEFSDYVGFIQRTAAQHGIYIADPDPMVAS